MGNSLRMERTRICFFSLTRLQAWRGKALDSVRRWIRMGLHCVAACEGDGDTRVVNRNKEGLLEE